MMERLRPLPVWLLVLVLAALLFLWHVSTDDTYSLILGRVAQGIVTTLRVTFISFALAFSLAVGLVLMLRGPRYLQEVARLYIELMRGIPMLVLLFYIAFVAGPLLVDMRNQLLAWPISWGWLEPMIARDFSLEWRAIVALSLGYAAFIAEILRAGINSVDRGQYEAARALGLSPWMSFRKVIWPQAVVVVIPPLVNDFVAMVKDSSLVSVFGVNDITQIGKVYASGTFKFFETWNVVAFLYLVLTVSLSLLARGLERWLKRGNQAR